MISYENPRYHMLLDDSIWFRMILSDFRWPHVILLLSFWYIYFFIFWKKIQNIYSFFVYSRSLSSSSSSSSSFELRRYFRSLFLLKHDKMFVPRKFVHRYLSYLCCFSRLEGETKFVVYTSLLALLVEEMVLL